ncbi:MAG: DUF4166 domain-containing protein [Methylobacter sp.]|uniref:DUF4166 domain-containing protein n=1 Tax=Methylovulum miyakonense TaxID=645578 RepID=UPI00036C6E74|nr:DUF4166 domain-containing protein [Methylovulum miyakonense]PPD43235.1 MAG: DUF4166 domain-containing protein [Methylobacter sp.]
MTAFLLQQVVGADWQKLPRVIQRHYEVQDGQGSCLQGVMAINYPTLMLPMVGIIHLFGGLIFRRGQAVQTRVEKTASADGNWLHWQRTMAYPDGKTHFFRSRMAYLAEHELIESIGYGFGIRLQVDVEDGDLVYRSNGHVWQCGGICLNLPDWLLLGTATISEHAVTLDKFYLDFTIRHPWWGETYSYRGEFGYC